MHNTRLRVHHKYAYYLEKASNEKTQRVRYGYMEDFGGSVQDMGIPWGFPQVRLWAWDGVRGLKSNPHSSPACKRRGIGVGHILSHSSRSSL